MTFLQIMNFWPSARVLSADIGAKHANVLKWRQRDSIPPEFWEPLIEAAERREIPVTLQMLATAARSPADIEAA